MNILQQFITGRADRQKSAVANAAQPITRAEFNTLVKAVEGLITDFDAVASPDKIASVLNQAVTEAMKESLRANTRSVAANMARLAGADRGFLVPADDRQPLALPGDEKQVVNAKTEQRGGTRGVRINGNLVPAGD